MTEASIQHLVKLAEESHDAANGLISMGHPRFSAAQSYYTMFYLAQAVLLTKGLTFSSHSAVIAAYRKEFAKTGLLDSKFHRHMIDAQERREVGHYGDEQEEVTIEQAKESFKWAAEFIQAVKKYLQE
jgi:uncharacterized protein (UPF0332 family)